MPIQSGGRWIDIITALNHINGRRGRNEEKVDIINISVGANVCDSDLNLVDLKNILKELAKDTIIIAAAGR